LLLCDNENYREAARRPLVLLVLIAAQWRCGVSELERPAPASPPADPPSYPADAAPPASISPDAAVAGEVDAAPPLVAPPDNARVPQPGVMLGGVMVPKSKVIVFLHVGHSNMAGRATGPADLKPYFYDTDPHLWAYAKGGAWRPAKEPLSGAMATGAGPGMAILRAGLNHAPDAYFVSIGYGQSGTEAGDCASFRKGGLLYDIVMGPARELVGKVTFGGIFTMLGITEHHLTVAQQQGFSDCMKSMADEMRGDLGEPDLPFMVGGYELGATRADVAPSTAFAKLIIAQIQLIPGKTPRSAVIPTDGLPMEDDHHYNMLGHRLWADRGMALLVGQGWAPWAAP
jgi:hypothetical protein